MGLLSRHPHIFIPPSLLIGPRPSFHQATLRGWFSVSIGYFLSFAVVPLAALPDALRSSFTTQPFSHVRLNGIAHQLSHFSLLDSPLWLPMPPTLPETRCRPVALRLISTPDPTATACYHR
ncbi:hypothetical protein BDP81DRAFT_407282 [Colletotrichum phormii]|uniref:Uncharacterized protein n=1 Tax=Colletotrichum phormii TaxID=359342 RepID=A0AAJ0EED1_9PEZI|nr:uncharacterized protein BDP81DRAFT_407282 [Colletotrichum phormii]KAK1635678.1 hypothetical protein BDP81DRAFT_407282 [Colletotrichum phormii]